MLREKVCSTGKCLICRQIHQYNLSDKHSVLETWCQVPFQVRAMTNTASYIVRLKLVG